MGGPKFPADVKKISKKIIFRYIALCSQGFVFIVLLVEEQYGPLFDFQKWHPPFFFFFLAFFTFFLIAIILENF